VVNLSFDLPSTWRWKGAGPPEQFGVDRDFEGSWSLAG
jgi:hypothetical protein